jgi:hypothetical protein
VEIVIELLAAIAVYLVMLGVIALWFPKRACLLALSALVALLCIYWLGFDQPVHANGHYYMRTALVVATPVAGIVATFAAMNREGLVVHPLARFQNALALSPVGTCGSHRSCAQSP